MCFGHQSVGANLMNGLAALGRGRLNIVEGATPQKCKGPVFAHFRVGQNGDPLSKIRDFASVMNAGMGECIDVAFFKLCYVDITALTDVDDLFDAYRNVMDSLVQAYPAVTFLHVTAPLRRIDDRFLNRIRVKCGVVDLERKGQRIRHTYNQLLRSRYGASGRLFDLAAEEATNMDGSSAVFQYFGQPIPNLVSEYTDDGGHLNKPAAERIACRLLDFVSSAAEVRGIHGGREVLP